MEADGSEKDEEVFGLAGWSGRSRGMASAHRHLDLEVNFVLAGTMSYLVGGRIVELPRNRLCLLWGGVPHQMLRNRQAAEAIWVTIPLVTVLRWGLPEQLIRPLLATGFLEDHAPRSGDLALLHQWLSDLPGRGERTRPSGHRDASQRIALLEIEARLRRFALDLAPQTPTDVTGAPHQGRATDGHGGAAHADPGLAPVEAMARFITGNFHEPLTVAQIAQAAHLHPNYAMTLFRRHTGMTLSQYLTLQRVAHAQRCLATSGDAISAIAFDSGFGSVSRFYEAFRQTTGNSPRRFRLQMAAPPQKRERPSETG